MKTREEAANLLKEYTKSDSLLKHAYAVEQAMRSYAEEYDEDIERWGIAGLLHDFDYEQYPSAEQHPFKGAEILKNNDYPQDVIDAVLGHADYTGVKRESLMAKTLFAVDELCGFLMACAYVRPDRKMENVKAKSVKKKLKDKSFAKGVNREDIEKGIIELDVDKTEHIEFVINSLSEISDKLDV